MITPQDCVNQIEGKNPNIKIVSVKDYGPEYLLTYEATDGKNAADPFLLISKKTGMIQQYTIAEDPSRYYSTPDISF